VCLDAVRPPLYVEQICFNLLSPSHEGAFVHEARQVRSMRAYLSTDFYARIARPPAELRGTRVISNPAGMTVLAWGVDRALTAVPALDRMIQDAFGICAYRDVSERDRHTYAQLLTMAAILTLCWAASIVPAYRLCRLWLAPPASMAVSLACVFNPATANFTPGKDPAQLLTVLLLLHLALRACVSNRRIAALAAGAVLAGSLTIGLIHVWIALIVIFATGWHAHRHGAGLRAWAVTCVAPAVGGFVAAAVLLWALTGWNIVHSTWAVAQRYPEIQRHLINGVWTLVGLPLFLLFAGPMLWGMVLAVRPQRSLPGGGGPVDAGDDAARLGRALLTCTAAVMVYTYFFANNNETPRLWIPFLAMLIISMSLTRDAFRTDAARHRRVLVVLIAAQIVVSALQWSMMDVREAEYRILPGPDGSPPRLWD